MVDIYTQFGAYYGDVVTIHRNTLLALFALVLMGLGVPLAAAQGSGIQYQHSAGIVTLETEDLSLRVTGVNEVPHFHWWDPDSPTVDYHVMFVKFFEANDTNSNGAYDVETDVMVGPPLALPTADWEFSGFELEQEGDNVTAVHFNFTSTEEHEPRPMDTGESYGSLPEMEPFDVMVQIRVHIDLENPGEMKFDLIVDGWQWTFNDTILVFHFTVTESNHGTSQAGTDPTNFQRTGTKFSFGNGYMEYNETALAAQNTLEVKASYGEETALAAGQAVYLAFENFGNETLEYDPILGIEPSTAGADILLANLPLIGAGVVAVVVIAVIVLRLKK
ncbi:MAG: hypothetical protein V3T87_00485 [Candidatus Thorarchaeota archaeon]